MVIELNHTIVRARDKHIAAAFLADILGVAVGAELGPFVPITLGNGVTLDYLTSDTVSPQHYAFLVDDGRFDTSFARIRTAGLPFYGEPGGGLPGEINRRWGGRGVYFDDPNGHVMELLTRTP